MSKKNIKTIFDAIVDFILNNATFESKKAINECIKKIELSSSMEDTFRIPINDRVFNFTTSLQWLYFICFLIEVIKDTQIEIPPTFNIVFSTDTAIIYISSIFNVVNESLYDEYFNDLNTID